ncbi:MAG: site-2 protease family protein [archaeon]
MSFLSFVIQYKWIILFYLAIILIVVLNKKKFTFQAKFIALYRTTVGIKLMHKIADRFGPLIRGFGYIGIFIGYAGMALIVYFLLDGIYKLIFVPSAPATLAPVIPGIPIPGSPIFVPFWYGILALFTVVVIHEFGHGVVAAAHRIRVKHSGIVFFGPLIGAFVEPDEKELTKKSWWVQQSMFAAGPVANGLLAVVVILLLLFILFPTLGSMVSSNGYMFQEITEGFPALEAGVQSNTIYTMVNGVVVNNGTYLSEVLAELQPGDTITIGNDELTHTIVTVQNPDVPERAFIGIMGLQSNLEVKDPAKKQLYGFFVILSKFLQWVFVLSIGIGLANLLPLGPVDGGRMFHQSLDKRVGKKKALIIFSKITVVILVVILVLIVVPILKAVLL